MPFEVSLTLFITLLSMLIIFDMRSIAICRRSDSIFAHFGRPAAHAVQCLIRQLAAVDAVLDHHSPL